MDFDMDEEALHRRRQQRLQEMKRQKQLQESRRKKLKKSLPVAAGTVAVLAVLLFSKSLFSGTAAQDKGQAEGTQKEYDTSITSITSETDGGQSLSDQGLTEAMIAENEKLTQTGGAQAQNDGVQADAAQVQAEERQQVSAPAAGMPEAGKTFKSEAGKTYSAKATAKTAQPGEAVISSNAVFIDVDTGDILSQRNYQQIISPASMTKILTVLVAAEHVTSEDLERKFTITLDITDYSYVHDCSNVGFSEGEQVTVKDLFYGTILPSGADAALGLATYVAGDQDAFVALMNEKLKELGLSDTAHFTNCVGLYDENHYCTVYDMAMILEAALDNELCREVLAAHTYTTSSTSEHPEGITISNWFLRRIEDKETGAEILCGKTGFVAQSGSCAASYGEDENGKGYICVTADSTSSWRCIYDQVALYSEFTSKDAGSTQVS